MCFPIRKVNRCLHTLPQRFGHNSGDSKTQIYATCYAAVKIAQLIIIASCMANLSPEMPVPLGTLLNYRKAIEWLTKYSECPPWTGSFTSVVRKKQLQHVSGVSEWKEYFYSEKRFFFLSWQDTSFTSLNKSP